MSNFFSGKGPIKPQSMLPTEAMINAPAMHMGSGPVRIGNPPGFALHSRPGMEGKEQFCGEEDEYDDEYYPEDEPTLGLFRSF